MPKVGKGTYGCVYKPSLKCKEKKPPIFYENKVSKATYKANAINEVREQSKIDKIDDSFIYHLHPPEMCEATEKGIKNCDIKVKPDTLLIMILF